MESKNEYSEAAEKFLSDMWTRARDMMEVVQIVENFRITYGERIRGGAEEGRNPCVKLMEDMVRVRRSSYWIGIRVWALFFHVYPVS